MHIYAYLLHVMLLNKKKLIEISKLTAHLYLNVTKKHRAHPFYIENKTHSALGLSSFDAKQKINFTWLYRSCSLVANTSYMARCMGRNL